MAISVHNLVKADMRTAEMRVREALSYHDQGVRLEALMRLHRITPEHERDALFAVMAARLTLFPQAPTSTPARAGAA